MPNPETDFGVAEERLKAFHGAKAATPLQYPEAYGPYPTQGAGFATDCEPCGTTGAARAYDVTDLKDPSVPKSVPLYDRLARDARDARTRNQRTARALQLLEKYPFFEDLLEFLRLVPHVPIH